MPTKSERSAPMKSVSVPTRTICTTTRWRSAGTKAAARTVAKRRRVASRGIWRPSRRLAPRRVSAPGGRGAWPSASTAMGKLQVPGAEEPAVLARRERPGETPVARAVGARVPAHETVEWRPQGEEPPVLREQAVEERRRLAEGAPVVLLAAQPREHGGDHLVVARGLVHERLTPPEELEHAPALVVVVVHVLGLSPVGGPGVEARRDAPHVAPTVEGEDPPDLPVALAAAGPAVGGDEREAIVPPLDLRLGELEVSGEHHHPHAPVAGEVVEVQVEGCHRELAAALRAGAVEDEREEREAARPLGRRRRLLRRGRGPGAGTVGEEEQTEGLVVLLPARRGERVEDVGAVIVPGAAPLVQAEEGTDEEVARLGRALELDQGAEGRPAHVARGLVAGVAQERPQLHVERRGAGGEDERQRDRRAARAPSSERTQPTSGPARGSGTRRPASARRRWSSCAG